MLSTRINCDYIVPCAVRWKAIESHCTQAGPVRSYSMSHLPHIVVTLVCVLMNAALQTSAWFEKALEVCGASASDGEDTSAEAHQVEQAWRRALVAGAEAEATRMEHTMAGHPPTVAPHPATGGFGAGGGLFGGGGLVQGGTPQATEG